MKPPLIATLLCFALPVLATYGYGQSCNPSAQFVTANDTIYQGTVPAGTKYQTNYNEPVTAVYGTSTIYNGQAGTCNGGGTFNVILPSTARSDASTTAAPVSPVTSTSIQSTHPRLRSKEISSPLLSRSITKSNLVGAALQSEGRRHLSRTRALAMVLAAAPPAITARGVVLAMVVAHTQDRAHAVRGAMAILRIVPIRTTRCASRTAAAVRAATATTDCAQDSNTAPLAIMSARTWAMKTNRAFAA